MSLNMLKGKLIINLNTPKLGTGSVIPPLDLINYEVNIIIKSIGTKLSRKVAIIP